MKIPSGGWLGMVKLLLSLKSISIPITCGFATLGELKLPFVTHREFIIPTPSPKGIAANYTNLHTLQCNVCKFV